MSSNRHARSWVEIDTIALAKNFATLLTHAKPTKGIISVVKADAYGHGAISIAKALPQAALFAVATLEEALTLKAAVPHKDILLLSPSLPEEYPTLIHEGFISTISSAQEANALAKHAQNHPIRVCIKIDTGMGRIGIWWEDALSELEAIHSMHHIEVHSIATHLPSADEDKEFTQWQLQLIANQAPLWRKLFPKAAMHVANSAASLQFPQAAYDFIRTGIGLYGVSPIPQFQSLLQPILTWKSTVILLRDVGIGRTISYGRTFTTSRPMRLATIGVGYGDGYPRDLSQTGQEVLIHGKRCPMIGRVTMDQIVVDVTHLPETLISDEVVLLGHQGENEIPVQELAKNAKTILWEIPTRIGPRVQRIL